MSEDDKGFFGSLKGIIFEEEPEESPKAEAAREIQPPPPVSRVVVSAGGSSDAEHVEMCRAVITDLQKSLGPNSPYILFTDALSSLESDVTDEALRYRAAIKVLKLEPAGVLNEIQSALGVLEGKRNEKLGKLEEKETNEIGQMEKNYKSIEQQIVDTAAKLQELQKQKEELGVSIATNRQKITGLRQGLSSAFDDVRNLVSGYAAKFQQYIR